MYQYNSPSQVNITNKLLYHRTHSWSTRKDNGSSRWLFSYWHAYWCTKGFSNVKKKLSLFCYLECCLLGCCIFCVTNLTNYVVEWCEGRQSEVWETIRYVLSPSLHWNVDTLIIYSYLINSNDKDDFSVLKTICLGHLLLPIFSTQLSVIYQWWTRILSVVALTLPLVTYVSE